MNRDRYKWYEYFIINKEGEAYISDEWDGQLGPNRSKYQRKVIMKILLLPPVGDHWINTANHLWFSVHRLGNAGLASQWLVQYALRRLRNEISLYKLTLLPPLTPLSPSHLSFNRRVAHTIQCILMQFAHYQFQCVPTSWPSNRIKAISLLMTDKLINHVLNNEQTTQRYHRVMDTNWIWLTSFFDSSLRTSSCKHNSGIFQTLKKNTTIRLF